MSAWIKEQYYGGLCGDDLHSLNDRGADMGVLIPLTLFIFVVVPLCALLEWLMEKSWKLERRIKRLEEVIFDGPGGAK
jgi:hypothetical protein